MWNLGARLFKIFPPAIGLVPFRGALWGPEIPKMEELFKRLDMMEHLGAKGQGWWLKPAVKLVVSLHIPSFSKSFSPKLENDMWISDWFMNFKGQTRDDFWRCRLGELETISYGASSPPRCPKWYHGLLWSSLAQVKKKEDLTSDSTRIPSSYVHT